jgi:hypothetical protein
MRKLLVIVLILGVSISLFAGPFGIEMGWTLEDLDKNGIKYELYKENYNVSTYDVFPKTPHADFPEYIVRIDTQKGIYEIIAFGKDISAPSYGTALKEAYKKVRDQVSRTYGIPKEFDYLKNDSIWDEPGDWMTALKVEDRTLVSYWFPTTDNIAIIVLETLANNSSEGFIKLVYQTHESIVDEIFDRLETAASSVF